MPQPPTTDPFEAAWEAARATTSNPPAPGGFDAAWEQARQQPKRWNLQPFTPPRAGSGPTGRVEPAAPDAPPSVEEDWQPDQPHVPGTSPAERTKSAATAAVDAAQRATGTTIGSQAAEQAGTLGRTAAVAKGAWDASWDEAKANLGALIGVPRGQPAPTSEDDQGLSIIAEHANPAEQVVGGLAGMAPSFADPKVLAAMAMAKAPTSTITNSPLARAAMGAVGRAAGPTAQAAATAVLSHTTGGAAFGAAHAQLNNRTIGETAEEAAFTGGLGAAFSAGGAPRAIAKERAQARIKQGRQAMSDVASATGSGNMRGQGTRPVATEPARGGAGLEHAAATMDEASFHEFTTRILADQTMPMEDRLAMTDELVKARQSAGSPRPPSPAGEVPARGVDDAGLAGNGPPAESAMPAMLVTEGQGGTAPRDPAAVPIPERREPPPGGQTGQGDSNQQQRELDPHGAPPEPQLSEKMPPKPQETTDAIPNSERGHADRIDAGPEAKGQARQTEQGPALQERPETETDAGQRPAQPGAGGSGAVREGGDGQVQKGVLTQPEKAHKFSSTHANLPPEIGKKVKAASEAIPEADLAEDGREADPHITVKYGLHTEDAARVQELLAGEPPIRVQLGKTSIFAAKEGADYDVVKVDVDSPDLHRLNAKIADALDHTDTHPTYQPHVTLAYVKPGLGKKYTGMDQLAGTTMELGQITFSDRSGKTTEIRLGGPKAAATEKTSPPTVPNANPRDQAGRTSPTAEQRGQAPEPVAERGRGPGPAGGAAAATPPAPGPIEQALARKPKPGEYSRGDIERRLIEAHRATGLAPETELSASEAEAAGHDTLDTRFKDHLPGEIRSWVEEDPSRRAMVSVVQPGEPGYEGARGADVMAALDSQTPGEYLRRLELRQGGRAGQLDAAKAHAHTLEQMDPATKLLAVIHDGTPERRADQAPRAVIDQPERIPQGSTLTINGEKYTVGTSDGEPVLIGDQVTTYLRALESLPYDAGSLKGPGETKAPSSDTSPPSSDTSPPSGETIGAKRGTEPPLGETPPPEVGPPEATSARKAWTDIDREIMGNDPLQAPQRRGWQQDLDEARAKGLHEPDAAMRTATAILQNPRALSSTETAGLVHHLARLKLEHTRLHKEVEHADPTDTIIAGEEILRIEQEHDLLTEALRKSGTEKGRALASQKLTLDQDFSLITVLNRAKAATGDGALQPETRARLEALTKELEDRTRQVAELQAKIDAAAKAPAPADARLEAALAETQAALTAARERAAKAQHAEHHERMLREAAEKQVPAYIRDLADRFRGRMKQSADAALARIKARGTTLRAGIDPIELADYAILGAHYLTELGFEGVTGAAKLAEWTNRMVKDLGAGVRAHLEEIHAAAQRRHDAELDKESRTVRSAVRKKRERAKTPAAIAAAKAAGPATIDKLKARAADGTPHADLRSYFQKLALEIVRGGTTDREKVLDELHRQVAPIFEGITREQTRDTLSGYGQWKELDKEAAKARLREITAESQKLAQLEALQRREAPKATGMERQPPSDAARALTKQVNDAKKALGISAPAGPARLKTLLETAKTRIRNQIRDLQTEIDTGTRMVRRIATPLSDPEIAALKLQLDAVRKAHQAAFTPPGLTDAQRLQLATNAAQRAAEAWEKRAADAKAGTFWSKEQPRRMSSPELEALRARAEAARAAFDELRALDPAQKASDDAKTNAAYRARLTERKAALLERMAKADFGPRPKKPAPPLDAASLAQKADVEATQQEFNAAKAIQRLKEQIAALQAHQAAGTLPAGPKPRKPEAPAVAAMRETVRQIKSALNQSDPALRARFEAQIRAMEARLAAGVTAPTKKPEPALTKELAKLAYERDLIKRKINAAIRDLRPKSSWQTLGAPINLSRSLVTSMDLSGTLRQGGFINIGSAVSPGNAKRMAASLKAQGLALISDQNAREIQAQITNREDAPLWDRAKLYLAPLDGELGKREEATMSKLADRIPLVGGSQRAYVVGLNKLRADTATAMGRWVARNGTPTLAEARVIANFVNAATGRGHLPLGLEQASVLLNTVFFSPRYLASRIQIAIAQPLWTGFSAKAILKGQMPEAYKGTGRARLAVAAEYGKALAGLAVVYSAAQLAGLSVSFDPRSSDFGKIIVGTTRIDPLMGFAQLITLAGRTITGQTKAIDSGRITPADPAKLLARTFRSKLAPFPGLVWDLSIGGGKEYDGTPMTPLKTAAGLVLPMSYGDIFKAIKEEGIPAGAAMGILSLLGMSLQTHEVEELEKQLLELKSPKERLDKINAAIKDLPPKEQERVRRRLIQQHRVLVAPTKAR